jgi:hypothetical protein
MNIDTEAYDYPALNTHLVSRFSLAEMKIGLAYEENY